MFVAKSRGKNRYLRTDFNTSSSARRRSIVGDRLLINEMWRHRHSTSLHVTYSTSTAVSDTKIGSFAEPIEEDKRCTES